ncbi:MAG: 30S ribosomal protein S6 [Oscillospiraceae bacterium]|nr:30S ribosomal protein S6 [Oscillospiraceae bacterium]
MAKINANYELMVIFNTKLGEEGIKDLAEKFKTKIEKEATLTSVDEWGKRKLAYAIEDETEGYYVIYTFESKPDFPAEIERVLNISEGVLRSLVTVSSAEAAK